MLAENLQLLQQLLTLLPQATFHFSLFTLRFFLKISPNLLTI